MCTQPDIAKGRVVDHNKYDWQLIACCGGDLNAVHAHTSVASDDRDSALRLRALNARCRSDGPAHRSEVGRRNIGAGFVSFPVVTGEGAMGAGIYNQDAVTGENSSQFADDPRRMDGCGSADAVFDILQAGF